MRRPFLVMALRSAALWAAGCTAGAGWTQPLSLSRLQRLLQDMPRGDVRFTELRESRWLAAPVASSGTLRSSADMLERNVEVPRRETWRILNDRMQLSTPGSDKVTEIALDKAPAVAALAQTLRSLMAGNVEALNAEFELVLSGDERDWSLELTPRRPEVSRKLQQINVQGGGRHLSSIVIIESQGDRTTTRLQYPE